MKIKKESVEGLRRLILERVDHFLDSFFNPKSIAIVGATNNPFKINFRIMQNLVNLNFKGKIYPVNLQAREVLGIKAVPRLQDIEDKIDLVVSSVPASRTMDIVKDCDLSGVKNLVIVTGGFSEAGELGQKIHQEIASFIKAKGIRTLGPNTLSPINTSKNLVISFTPIKKMKQGDLSLAFQSGFYEPKINWLFSHLGINKILDMGNKMDINEVDALEYFSQDYDTKVLAMHIESVHGNGRDFFYLLKSVCRKKPVIILKSGRTQAGSQAAASHTGSMASENDVIFDAAIKQAGAILAYNQEEFFELAKAFQFLELPNGNSLAIITFSGGEGVMATDACDINGLKLAHVTDKTYLRLKRILPPWEIPLNPFDVGLCVQFHFSDLSAFFYTLAAIPEDENVHCVIMQMPPPRLFAQPLSNQNRFDKEKFIQIVLEMKRQGKLFALWRSSMDILEAEMIELIESNYLPVFQSSVRAIKAFSAMYRYKSIHLSNQRTNNKCIATPWKL